MNVVEGETMLGERGEEDYNRCINYLKTLALRNYPVQVESALLEQLLPLHRFFPHISLGQTFRDQVIQIIENVPYGPIHLDVLLNVEFQLCILDTQHLLSE